MGKTTETVDAIVIHSTNRSWADWALRYPLQTLSKIEDQDRRPSFQDTSVVESQDRRGHHIFCVQANLAIAARQLEEVGISIEKSKGFR